MSFGKGRCVNKVALCILHELLTHLVPDGLLFSSWRSGYPATIFCWHGVRHMFAEPTWDPKLIVSKTSNLMLETWSCHFCRSWISRGSAYACLTLTLIQIPWVSQFYGNNTSLLCRSRLDEVIHIVGSGSPQTKSRWMTYFRWPCTSRTVFGVHLNVSFAKTAHARHGIRWRSGNAAWLVRRDYECAYLSKKICSTVFWMLSIRLKFMARWPRYA